MQTTSLFKLNKTINDHKNCQRKKGYFFPNAALTSGAILVPNISMDFIIA